MLRSQYFCCRCFRFNAVVSNSQSTIMQLNKDTHTHHWNETLAKRGSNEIHKFVCFWSNKMPQKFSKAFCQYIIALPYFVLFSMRLQLGIKLSIQHQPKPSTMLNTNTKSVFFCYLKIPHFQLNLDGPGELDPDRKFEQRDNHISDGF